MRKKKLFYVSKRKVWKNDKLQLNTLQSALTKETGGHQQKVTSRDLTERRNS